MPYIFEDGAPAVTELHERAEKLGGLPIKVTSRTSTYDGGSDDFEFSFLPGKVTVDRSSDEVFLSSYAGEAPVLLDLLTVVLQESGGRLRDFDERVELELPLTETGVRATTAEYQSTLKRLARRAGLLVAGLVALGLGLAGAVIWALWALFTG